MIGEALVRLAFAALQGSVLFLVVWAVCKFLPGLSPTWRCWLWRCVPLKLLIALIAWNSVTLSMPSPQAAVIGTVKNAPTRSNSVQPLLNSKTEHPVAEASRAAPTTDASINAPSQLPEILLGTAWLFGFLYITFRGIAGWLRVRSLLRDSTSADISEARELFGLGGQMVGLRLRTLSCIDSPALIGVLRPTILLPWDYRDLSNRAVNAGVAHELAHLKRKDMPWVLIAEFAKAIFWFLPFSWIACREQLTESEIAADQLARMWAGSSPRDYAESLLEWIDSSRQVSRPLRSVPGMLLSTHQFTRRMKSMSINRYRPSLMLGSLLFVSCAIAMVPLKVDFGGDGLAKTTWPSFHGGSAHTGFVVGESCEGIKKWTFDAKADSSGVAIGPDRTLYFGTLDKQFYAISSFYGTLKWSFKGTEAFCGTPAVASDGTVYAGTVPAEKGGGNGLHNAPYDGTFYAFDGSTGAIKWKFRSGLGFLGSPAIGKNGTVFVNSLDGQLYAFDGKTGDQKWTFATDSLCQTTPAIGPDGTLYLAYGTSSISALDGNTGKVKWTFKSGESASGFFNLSSPAIGKDGTIYCGACDGALYALDGQTGEKKWAFRSSDGVHSTPSIDANGDVYIGSWDGSVYAVNGKTGAKKWSFSTRLPLETSVLLDSQGTAYMPAKDGNLYAIDTKTGDKKWSRKVGGVPSEAALDSDGSLYFGSSNGDFSSFR